MESNYRNREFEQFVKENVDQYRMFPSEKVWKGINNTLHTRRKWYGLGLALALLLTGTAVTWVMVSYPVSKNQKMAAAPATAVNATEKAGLPAAESATSPNILPFINQPSVHSKLTPAEPQQKTLNVIPLFSESPVAVIPEEEQFVAINTTRPQVSTLVPARTNRALTTTSPAGQDVIAGPVDNNYVSENNIDQPAAEKTITAKTTILSNEQLAYPLPTEAIIASAKNTRKISWQLYFTPTISYRKLAENKSFDNSGPSGIPAAPKNDVNNEVTHKPDMGLQVGVAARYKLTRGLKLRAGVQFNINRYDIKAVAYNPELATIELNGENGNASTLATWTSYRNNRKANSYRSDWLKNFYFSVSIPIGAEMILLGKNKKTNFGIAGTVQPSYIIKDRAYVISSNYKNYANVPSLTRHVNINTGFETFVNFTNGHTRWQMGPQVRYQVLSSFNNKYPVKENLFDFGVKIGVTLNE